MQSLGCVEVGCRMVDTHVVIVHVIGDAKEPCGEGRATLKAVDVGVCFYKGVLCEVISQLPVAMSLRKKESAYGRLVLRDQSAKGMPVVVASHPCD